MAVLTVPLQHPSHDTICATIDSQDRERVGAIGTWYAMKTANGTWYAKAVLYSGGLSETILLHRFILGTTDPKLRVDHIDRNGLNCQRSNLRECSVAQNNLNSKLSRANSSGFKGVSFDKRRGLWMANISVGNRQQRIGRFLTKEEAAHAYDDALRSIGGEFGRYNFPREGERPARVTSFEKL